MSHTAQDWPIGAAVLPFPNTGGEVAGHHRPEGIRP